MFGALRLDLFARGDHHRRGLGGTAVPGSGRSARATLASRHRAEALPERVFVETGQAVDVLPQLVNRWLPALDEDEVLIERLDELLTSSGRSDATLAMSADMINGSGWRMWLPA